MTTIRRMTRTINNQSMTVLLTIDYQRDPTLLSYLNDSIHSLLPIHFLINLIELTHPILEDQQFFGSLTTQQQQQQQQKILEMKELKVSKERIDLPLFERSNFFG